MQLTTSGATRGCGKRKQGGLYLCVGFSPSGAPIEKFVVDPPIPWVDGHFQGAEIRPRGKTGINDVIMWVGEEFYPYVPDFAEEVRRLGLSKRVPASTDFSMLVPHLSRIILVHPKVIISASYTLEEVLAEAKPQISRPDPHWPSCHHQRNRNGARDPQCTFSLWDLSSFGNHKKHEVLLPPVDQPTEGPMANVLTPSASYNVMLPEVNGKTVFDKKAKEPKYSPGIFLALPFTHFEFVNKKAGVPEKIAKKLGDNLSHTAVTKE